MEIQYHPRFLPLNKWLTFKVAIVVFFSLLSASKSDAQVKILSRAMEQQTDTDSVKMSLSLSAPDVAIVSSPIVIEVTLKNDSDQPLFFPGGYSGYDFLVRSETKTPILPTLFGQNTMRTRQTSFAARALELPPRGSYSYKFPINRFYDMTKLGTYFLTASREVPVDGNPLHNKKIVSSEIHINVLPESETHALIEKWDKIVDSNYPLSPSDVWRVGDTWKAMVEVFKSSSPMATDKPIAFNFGSGPIPNNTIMVIDTFSMTIKIVQVRKVGVQDQATVQFVPSDDAPSYVQGRTVEAAVDRQTGQLVELSSRGVLRGVESSDVVEKLNDIPVLVRPINGYVAGFPCDIIPISALPKDSSSVQLSTPDKTIMLSISKTPVGEYELWSEKLSVRDNDWFRVTQRWNKGQKWWSQYVKEDFDSQIGMRATIIGSSEVTFGVPKNGLQLGLGSEDALASGGSAVHLRVALRNTTDKDVTLKPILTGDNVTLTVMDAAQRVVPLTIAGKEASAKPYLLFDKQILPAHSTIYRDLLLSRHYDFSLNGSYSVSAFGSQIVEGMDAKLAASKLNVRIVG